ncbi:hypothetical protein WJX82_002708 [Trebouxia sp. C0006]
MDITTVGVARKDGIGQLATSISKQNCFTRNPAESACSTSSDSDEECLRPSLLKKHRQPREICHPGNVPTNHQNPTGRHKTLTHSDSPELQQQQGVPVSGDYCSTVRQTPFAPLSPSCPSSGAPSNSCFTPTAEHDLFGSPATSVPPEGTPACRGSMFDSPGLQKQLRHGDGPSKALAHISRLQRERAHLLQQIKGHEQQQQQAELLMQDADFLHSRLQMLKSSSGAAGQAASRPRGAETEASLESQPAKAETLELWQQLSSESSNSNEAHQLEELQAQLCHTTKQLRTKEEEVVRCEHEEAAEAHIVTEATLLDQLHETQAELDQSSIQVRHFEQRHQEMCQQLTFARAKLKKSRASQLSLLKELELAKAETVRLSERQAEAVRAQLEDMRSQLDAAQAEVAQAHAQIDLLNSQMAQLAQQLAHSHDKEAQLTQQLQAVTTSLESSQTDSSQTMSDCLELRCQLKDASAQLEQSCSRQAEYAVEQQRGASELQAAHAEGSRLADALAQAERAKQAVDAQLKDVHSQHRKLRAKAEQVAVRCAGYDSLLVDLAEAQTQLAAHCAHVQIERQRNEGVTQRLVVAGNMLSKTLYNLQPASPQLPKQGGVGVELGTTAEQVCSLVEALLTHQASTQPLAQATDAQPSVAASRPVDALRSHVAQAQARANHIVDEFESMLLVTGGHSMKQIMHIQSQAGLAEDTSLPAAASAAALPLAGLSRPNRKTSPALKGTTRQTRDSSTSTGPPSLSKTNSGGTRRSGKSSVTSSKENRAPALTYVTGGQIRGARRAHESAARQPLKPSIADNSPGLSTADVLTHKARMTGVHKLKH